MKGKKIIFIIFIILLIQPVLSKEIQINITPEIHLKISIEENQTNSTINQCDNFSFENLPQIQENKETIHYSFSGWKAGDNVSYWIENSTGGIIKEARTTTSKTKKSYTPKTTRKETILIFKAEREREGCEIQKINQTVGIIGKEKEKEIEEKISSLYIRAKKYQEEITLYGTAKENNNYWIIGEESPFLQKINKGQFKIKIHPKKENNTYGIIPEQGGSIKIITFNLKGKEEGNTSLEVNISIKENKTSNETGTSYNGSISIPINNSLTGEVIKNDTNTTKTTALIGTTTLIGISILLKRIKTKILRSKQDSV